MKEVRRVKIIYRVRCNNCMNEFDEDEIIYNCDDDTEYCPRCGESGCLMDIDQGEEYEKASE